MTDDYDWTKFSARVNIKAEMQSIYDAWTKPENLEKWFLSKAEFSASDDAVRAKGDPVQKDDTYTWCWHGYSEDVTEKGKVLDTNGKDLFQFTFSGDCLVTVIIKEEAGENLVELWQENIPANEAGKIHYHLGCLKGWTFYLANLKSILEGGPDLRNKNEKLANMINA